MSDLVCSKDIPVGKVLRKASDLMKMLNESSKCEDEQWFGSLTENALLHEAVSVLRRRISVSKKLEGEYHSSEEMSSLKLKEWVDPVLYKFTCWVTDKNLFDNGAEVLDLKPNLPALNIACDIISQSTSIISPKHLGLAVYLHHEFGGRTLVDSLQHAMGYCISYTELCRFLTSAAEHINASQEPTSTGAYKPPEITSRNEGGHLIIAVADNWDHNESTADRKRTTHAMTNIFVQRISETNKCVPRILIAPRRTLNLEFVQGGNLSKLFPYFKPKSRPEPKLQQPVSFKDIQAMQDNPDFVKMTDVALAYNISRSSVSSQGHEGSCFPPWGLFHAATDSEINQAISVVSFNQIVMANPTNHQTIYTIL